MAARLVAEKGLVKGLVLSFEDADEWFIGRDPDECQLVVEDPKISRKHVLCKKVDEGIILENLSSTNPIWINQDAIQGPYLLQEGDRLRMGDGFFRFFSGLLSEIPEEEEEVSDDFFEDQEGHEEAAVEEEEEEETFEESETEAVLEEEPLDLNNSSLLDDDEDGYYDTIYTEKELTFGTPIYSAPLEKTPVSKESDTPSQEGVQASEQKPFLPDTRWLLKVMTGPSTGAEYPLEEGNTYVIGSDDEKCDITLHDISISRQHARLTLTEEESLQIEDLSSRNGLRIDGTPIEGEVALIPSHLVSLGTSSFLIIDKEMKLETLTTLPESLTVEQDEIPAEDKKEVAASSIFRIPSISTGKFALVSVLLGIVSIIGIGSVSLLKTEDVKIVQINTEDQITEIISDYPDIEFDLNNSRLFVLGHVTTSVERDRLLHALRNLNYVDRIDDHIVIDELVWQETNQILSKNPSWRSISIYSPVPGQFVLSGYLQSNSEAEALIDYMNVHFDHLDRLQNKVVVEEQLIETVNVELIESAFSDVFAEITSGELTISGYMSTTKAPELRKIMTKMKRIPGIRSIKNFVVELAPEDSMINLSDRYDVTGHFRHANVNVSVVINGRILARGDTLDGMTITSIKSRSIFLEKDGFKFRIDYIK
jgi:type III secretion system YscD/HrpQ family protein